MTSPDAKARDIRFGILYGGAALENWQSLCLRHLAELPHAHAAITIAPEQDRVPLPGALERLPNADAGLSAGERAVALEAASIASVRDCRLDFILCFVDADLPAQILDLARFGVWRYQWGDRPGCRGPAVGFWEVYDRCPVSAARLVRVRPNPDMAVVLREGFLRTRTLSARRNREQLLARFVHWPAQLCAEIARGGSPETLAVTPPLAAPQPPAPGGAERAPPKAWQRAALGAGLALRAAATAFRSLFRHDQWNVGIVDLPIERFLTLGAPAQVRWLPATRRAELRADPFGTVHAGRRTILCEHFSYRDHRGYIVALDGGTEDKLDGGSGGTLDGSGTRVDIGPRPPVHLSYPFLFEAEGKLLCVPESSAAQEIALYEAERFPDVWRKTATLVEGCAFADATLFEYEGRWWMAASDVADKGANSELHLWYAAAPEGPWQPHPGNPVKIDIRSARPAGTPFWVQGVLYRPAQDCSSTYGARVSINRILALSPLEFR
ncbi:MAG TPA: hypothetical protein VHV81_02125, partial [Steroidobacteraceae bacterium]|nr:hypothetical protein [Steroidobacteraceae bacterium]